MSADFKDLVSVARAAVGLGVSTSRVRVLLKSGRLFGYKDSTLGEWRVFVPFRLTPGRRGPKARFNGGRRFNSPTPKG